LRLEPNPTDTPCQLQAFARTIKFSHGQSLQMTRPNFLPEPRQAKDWAIALLHPLRKPVAWACQHRLLPSWVRRVLPWRWALEPFTIYGKGWKSQWFPAEFDDITHRIFWSGLHDYEKETIPVILDEVRQARCFIDVGANCGIYTVLGATTNPHVKIVAIEPVPKICAALTNNITQNRLNSRVTILNLAVGSSNGVVDFHEAEDARMGSLAVHGYQGQAGRIIRAECRTLDSIVAELNIEPDFIKIDVEGFSDAVLAGARRLLEDLRPSIVLEANPGDPCSRITAILTSHRYAMHLITDDGLEWREQIIPSTRYRNWLCRPLPPGSQRAG
jgi:FkbM family methyltransferase